MAGKQVGGGSEAFSSQLAGMSKNQLYDVMSQMKTLIEQNQQQAKQILVENPVLTKALFQAQIMLGMVQPPQKQNIPQVLPKKLTQAGQQPNVQTGMQGGPIMQNNPNQPSLSAPSATAPPASLPPPMASSHPLQTSQQGKSNMSTQATTISLPHSHSQMHTPSLLPPHSAPQSSVHQSQMPNMSSQSQQYSQTTGILHPPLQPLQPLQPPLPSQPRPPSMQPFPPQIPSQMATNLSFPPPQQHPAKPIFHPGPNNPQSGIGSSYPQLQQPPHPPNQKLYQVGSNTGADFSNQAGSSMQIDRGTTWMPGPPENSTSGVQLLGPPPVAANPVGLSIHQPRPQLTPEMEKALLQQVMSLTPEQINLLPPEQRNQVLQLQKMMR